MLLSEAHLSLEVEYADADLALGVVAGGGEGARVAEHGGARHRHAQDAAVLLRGVLDVGGRVVRQPRRRQPVPRRLRQVLRDEPVQLGPALELHHLPCRGLRQSLERKILVPYNKKYFKIK